MLPFTDCRRSSIPNHWWNRNLQQQLMKRFPFIVIPLIVVLGCGVGVYGMFHRNTNSNPKDIQSHGEEVEYSNPAIKKEHASYWDKDFSAYVNSFEIDGRKFIMMNGHGSRIVIERK